MKLLNHTKGTTLKKAFLIETAHNIYDSSNVPIAKAELLTFFGHKYIIDSKVTDTDVITINAHRHDTTRKLYHTITFVIDWANVSFHYDIKKYDIT